MEYRLQYRFAHLNQVEDNNWIDMTPYIEEPDKITFSFGQSDTNNHLQLDSTGIDKAVSSKLVVFGEAYYYVKEWLIDHPTGSINSIKVEIQDLICPHQMGMWEIKADNLQWCIDGECKLELNLTEYTPKGNCLKNTLITDNHRNWFPDNGKPVDFVDPFTNSNVPQYIHPVFRYCNDIKPQALQNFMFVLAHSIILIINPIIVVIQAVLDFISWVIGQIGGDFEGDENFEEAIDELYSDIFESLIGCNRKHPSPFVRNYFINACSKCGVTFESNIFNDNSSGNPHRRYYNTCHLFAPGRVGYIEEDVDNGKDWIPTNAPIETVLSYAYSLKDIFNAKFKLENGVFSFHTKDKFPDVEVFDFHDADKHLMISPMCYGWNASKKPKSMTFEYGQDVKDVAGDEARNRYNGTKDWTTSLSPINQKFYDGIKEIKAEMYSTARFTTDGIDRKLAFANLENQDFWEDGILLIEKGMTQLGKLIIWDGVSPKKEAKVVKVHINSEYVLQWPDEWLWGQSPSLDYWVFNYPLFFDWQTNEGYNEFTVFNTNQTHKNLYELHKIDNPTLGNIQNKTWETTLELCCDTLDKLLEYNGMQDGLLAHLDYLVKLSPTEKGTLKKVEVDYDKNEIRVSGEIKYT